MLFNKDSLLIPKPYVSSVSASVGIHTDTTLQANDLSLSKLETFLWKVDMQLENMFFFMESLKFITVHK